MMWIPKVVYNAVTFEFSQPQKLWTPTSRGVGGVDRSASAVTESFTIRREYLLDISLRFTEGEWSDVDSWLTWSQDNMGSTWDIYLDKNEVDTLYTVYLEKPSIEDGEIKPERADRHGIYEINVTIRNSDSERFDVSAYA